VVGVTGVYKLSPLFSHNQTNVLNYMSTPADVIHYNAPVNFDNVEVSLPTYDFIEPSLVDLYVTNNGSHQPSYIYRLLSEFYHPQDHMLN
jgi:translation initiation factor eIF-2B subunit beta